MRLEPILKSMTDNSIAFLQESMEITSEVDAENLVVQQITLNRHTAMIGIGGHLNVLFYIVYEEPLLDYLTQVFAGEEIPSEEYEEFKISAAGEIANIIVGHAIAPLAKQGETINITPPAITEQAQSIIRSKCHILKTKLVTSQGAMCLYLIGSDTCSDLSARDCL